MQVYYSASVGVLSIVRFFVGRFKALRSALLSLYFVQSVQKIRKIVRNRNYLTVLCPKNDLIPFFTVVVPGRVGRKGKQIAMV